MTPLPEADAVHGVIDIGTNSVKVLIARSKADGIESLYEESIQTRLGEGIYDSGLLRPEAIAHTAEVVRGFLVKGEQFGAVGVRILATSAARDAGNGAELAAAIHDAGGPALEIIEGRVEAEYVYRGVRSQGGLGRGPLLVADVGGGSTEFILGQADEVCFARSFPLGTVRQLSRTSLEDPPGAAALVACRTLLRGFLTAEVLPGLEPVLGDLPDRPTTLVGTGGTTTFLGMIELATNEFDRGRLEAVSFRRGELESATGRLWDMTADRRKELRGLPADRADVILFGAVIFLSIMDVLALETLQVSTRGVRFGALRGN